MKTEGQEFFSSRMGLVLAGIGMAVGTGNIWRFPRIAGKNGGLAFIVCWLLALFIWSIPLMMAEMVIGRESRKGPVGALRSFAGEKFTFLGAWVAFVTLAIMFYYSVVAGWCLRYFTYFVAGMVPTDATAATNWWNAFTGTPWQPILFHFLAMVIAAFVVAQGIQAGLERANKVLLPALFVMLVGLVIRALTLEGSWEGVRFLFHLDTSAFLQAKTWLEAFSQSAWSTGAGWGLLLTFAVYSDVRESKPATDCTIIGFSNNLASMLAALVVIPTVFALSGTTQAAKDILSKGNTGLTFTSLASLFGGISAGWLFGAIFFLALFFAALTSLISMVELGARMLIDFGMDRRKAVTTIGIIAFLFGIPSAVYMPFFNNQDWVWGVGLLVSGLFIAIAVILRSVSECADMIFPKESTIDRQLWSIAITFIIPIMFVILTGWWLHQGATWETKIAWYNPIAQYSPGTVLAQWALALAVLISLNGIINYHLTSDQNEGGSGEKAGEAVPGD